MLFAYHILFYIRGELGALSINNEYYYDVPWTRAPPYFIGIFLGWLLLKTNNNEQNLKMPKVRYLMK